VACIWATLRPEARQLATLIVGLSMLSFLILYLQAGQPQSLRVIAIADLLGLPFLLIVAWYAFIKA
jgi:selenocysteine-specific translation elongation factor